MVTTWLWCSSRSRIAVATTRSERLTGALLDRLTHHVHILEMNGDSYRLRQSKRHQRAARAASIPDSPSAT
jgi:hypothetical protein